MKQETREDVLAFLTAWFGFALSTPVMVLLLASIMWAGWWVIGAATGLFQASSFGMKWLIFGTAWLAVSGMVAGFFVAEAGHEEEDS